MPRLERFRGGKHKRFDRFFKGVGKWQRLSIVDQLLFGFCVLSSVISTIYVFLYLNTHAYGDKHKGKAAVFVWICGNAVLATTSMIAVRRNFAEVVLVLTTVFVFGIILTSNVDVLVNGTTP